MATTTYFGVAVFRQTAGAFLTSLIETGKVKSAAELMESIKRQGWLITRAGESYVTVCHPEGGRFRFRYMFGAALVDGDCADSGDGPGAAVVYALIAEGCTERACYIGSTSDFYNRMCQHAQLARQRVFSKQRESSDFLAWAAERNLSVRAMELERLNGRAMLLVREAAWTRAAAAGGWQLPGVSRWGAKTKRMPACPADLHATYFSVPQFGANDTAAARLLHDIVGGLDGEPKSRRITQDKSVCDHFAIQLLVNPLKKLPFYVGIVRLDEQRLEPGSGSEVFDCGAITDMIHAQGLAVQEVIVERAKGRQSVKQAKSFWIETLSRAGTALLNSGQPVAIRLDALARHGAAADGRGGRVAALSSKAAQNVQGAYPALPARHGEKWEKLEVAQLRAAYMSGVDIQQLADDLQRKITGIAAKLAHLAKDDHLVAQRLQSDGIIDEQNALLYLHTERRP